MQWIMQRNEPIGRLRTTHHSFDIFLKKFKDNRLRMYFMEEGSGEPSHKKQMDYDRNSIGFRVWDTCNLEKDIVLLGVTVEKNKRGDKLSFELLDAFFQFTQQMNLKLQRTGIIRKPIQAKMLKKYGFKPENQDTVVEILPISLDDNIYIPNINVIKNKNHELTSHNGVFYKIIPTNEVIRKYPITTSNSIISINTKYIITNHPQVVNKNLVIFKEKVLKIFDF